MSINEPKAELRRREQRLRTLTPSALETASVIVVDRDYGFSAHRLNSTHDQYRTKLIDWEHRVQIGLMAVNAAMWMHVLYCRSAS